MNKYKVTIGDNKAVEVEAANEAEATRKAMAPLAVAPVQPTLGPVKVELVEALPESPKHRYRVAWGDETKEVIAVHVSDAWTQFVGGNEDSIAYKMPGLHERVIEDLGPVEDEAAAKKRAARGESHGKTVIPGDHPHVGHSPVVNDTADLAIDKISRMRSEDQLHEIVNSDPRSTVVSAAKRRLTEL
jgi:hypothetical protein